MGREQEVWASFLGGQKTAVSGNLTPMSEPSQPRRRGRPPTGITPKRYLRVGAIWDEVERLARDISGETMTDVVKRLLDAERRRLLRLQRTQQAGE
jgi:hypothetical protein